jgi:lysophospholipase L1-like esterase
MTHRNFRLFAQALLCFAATTFAAAHAAEKIRVACVGDSITYGHAVVYEKPEQTYPAVLGKLLGDDFEVRNFGCNSATLVKIGNVPYWKQPQFADATKFNANIVIIALGVNDTKVEDWLKPEQFTGDLAALVEHFRAQPARPKVYLGIPVPVSPERIHGITAKKARERATPMIEETAKKLDVPLIDFYTPLQDRLELIPDTIHPNAEGYRIMAQTARDALVADKPAEDPSAEKKTADDTLVIGVVADNRGGSGIHAAALRMFKEAGAEIILNLGDMVYPNEAGKWEGIVSSFKEIYEDEADDLLAKRVFVTAGGWDEQFINQEQKAKDKAEGKENLGDRRWPGYEPDNAAGQEFYRRFFRYKERAGKEGEFIREYTDEGDYYVKYKNLHLVSLYISDEWPEVAKKWHLHDDPEKRREALARQTEWLDKKLQAIREADLKAPIIVMAHDGIWHKGSGATAPIARLLNKHHVDMALCGDGHSYYAIKDPWTMKFMVPGAFQGGSDGWFLIKLTHATGKISMEHYRYTGKQIHAHRKIAGERWE